MPSSRAPRLSTAANGRVGLRFTSSIGLVRGELRLEGGCDELGPYLLSANEASDDFLRRLAQ